MKKIDGIWFNLSSGYLVFDDEKSYSISSHKLDGEDSRYIAYSAWCEHIDDHRLKIKLCNLARSSKWNIMYYRFLGDKLQWNNGKQDFMFDKISMKDVCEEAIKPIREAQDKFLATYYE